MSRSELQQPLTTEEKKLYSSIFKTLDPGKTGKISGAAARPLLEASGLPLPTLGEIWNLADPDNTGYLDQLGFCTAMRLIGHAQQGETITAQSAQTAAPVAKFTMIPVNTTGGSSGFNSPQTSQASLANSVPALTPEQAAQFGAMFDRTAVNGILAGVQARDIFLKAKLPLVILEKIWNLVDQDQNGQLSRSEFIVAMHLIQSFLNKSMTILPTVLPDQAWAAAEDTEITGTSPTGTTTLPPNTASPAPATTATSSTTVTAVPTNLDTWIMSPEQRQQYGAIFDSLDKNKTGWLTGPEVANFLMTSKLGNEVLAVIWELANLDNRDDFNKQEFAIAMYLVQKKLAGYNLPPTIPAELHSSSAPLTASAPKQLTTEPQNRTFSAAAAAEPAAKPSHMDNLLDVFAAQAAAPVPEPAPSPAPAAAKSKPPAPIPRANTGFVPSSDFGRQLQAQTTGKVASPTTSTFTATATPEPKKAAPPTIPGRDNKPRFDSTDVLPAKSTQSAEHTVPMDNSQSSIEFMNQSASTAEADKSQASGFIAHSQPTDFVAQLQGFTNSPAPAPATTVPATGDRSVHDQLAQDSIDIANYSNQISSLSQQHTNAGLRKDKAQKELDRVSRVKEEIQTKLTRVRGLFQNESTTADQVERDLNTTTQEAKQLEQDLSIAQAQHHVEEQRLAELQTELERTTTATNQMRQELSRLNQHTSEMQSQSKQLEAQVLQAANTMNVVEQQVRAQENENAGLQNQVASLTQQIADIQQKQARLSSAKDRLEDQALELHKQNAELSSDYADQSIEYSKAVSSGQVPADEEVPTASLDDFDEEEFSKGANDEPDADDESTDDEKEKEPEDDSKTKKVESDESESEDESKKKKKKKKKKVEESEEESEAESDDDSKKKKKKKKEAEAESDESEEDESAKPKKKKDKKDKKDKKKESTPESVAKDIKKNIQKDAKKDIQKKLKKDISKGIDKVGKADGKSKLKDVAKNVAEGAAGSAGAAKGAKAVNGAIKTPKDKSKGSSGSTGDKATAKIEKEIVKEVKREVKRGSKADPMHDIVKDLKKDAYKDVKKSAKKTAEKTVKKTVSGATKKKAASSAADAAAGVAADAASNADLYAKLKAGDLSLGAISGLPLAAGALAAGSIVGAVAAVKSLSESKADDSDSTDSDSDTDKDTLISAERFSNILSGKVFKHKTELSFEGETIQSKTKFSFGSSEYPIIDPKIYPLEPREEHYPIVDTKIYPLEPNETTVSQQDIAAEVAAIGAVAATAAITKEITKESSFSSSSSASAPASSSKPPSIAPATLAAPVTTTETVQMPGSFVQSTPINTEFPPIQQKEVVDESSSDDEFEDTRQDLTPKEPGTPVTAAPVATTPSTNPFAQDAFDDLGLEEAKETSEDHFEPEPAFKNPVGFSFSQAQAQTTESATPADDWEQVFAGFGNDPQAKAAEPLEPVEPSANSTLDFSSASITTTEKKAAEQTASNYTQPQQLAIEELQGMGFSESKAVEALQKNKWNLEEASNYLLDTA